MIRTNGPKYTEKDILIYSRLDHNSVLETLQLTMEAIALLHPINAHAIKIRQDLNIIRKYLETKS